MKKLGIANIQNQCKTEHSRSEIVAELIRQRKAKKNLLTNTEVPTKVHIEGTLHIVIDNKSNKDPIKKFKVAKLTTKASSPTTLSAKNKVKLDIKNISKGSTVNVYCIVIEL